jgi:L-asparagine transporter-like permease
MSWNNWIRQFHRWVSVAFTVAVIINVIAMAQQQTAFWIGLLALVPLILLLITGLYMFVLPYASRARNERIGVNAMERQRV